MAKIPTSTAATHSGGRAANATMAPSTTAETAIPISMPGIGTPMTPSTPPKAITTGKVTGSTQIAGRAQLGAPHADRDHRDDVVEPEDRMLDPGDEAAAHIALADMGERHGWREQIAQRQPADELR